MSIDFGANEQGVASPSASTAISNSEGAFAGNREG